MQIKESITYIHTFKNISKEGIKFLIVSQDIFRVYIVTELFFSIPLLCLALHRCLWKWGHCLEKLIIKTPVNYILREDSTSICLWAIQTTLFSVTYYIFILLCVPVCMLSDMKMKTSKWWKIKETILARLLFSHLLFHGCKQSECVTKTTIS